MYSYTQSALNVLKSPKNLWRAAMFGTVVFFILTGITINSRLSTMGEESRSVANAEAALSQLAQLLGQLRDIELGQRGYLITRNRKFLRPKLIAERSLPRTLDALQASVGAHPPLLRALQTIRHLVQEKVQETNRLVRVQEVSGQVVAAKVLRRGRGKVQMDELRGLLKLMERVQEDVLKKRLVQLEETRNGSKFIAIATVVLTVVFALLTLYLNSAFRRNTDAARREASKRLIAEGALKASEERLRIALSSLPLRLYATNSDRRYTWIYDSASAEELIGKRDEEIYPAETVRELVNLQNIALQSGERARQVITLPYSGEAIAYDVIIDPVRDMAGEVEGLLVSAFDIQRQIDAQDEIKEREREFRTLANLVPQLVWVTDATGIPEFFNDRWYEYTGMQRDTVSDTTWLKSLHPDDRQRTLDRWNRSVTTGEFYEVEYRLKRYRDNQYRWFIARGIPVLNDAGRVERWFGSCTDIQDQKELSEEREQLLQSERSARDSAERVIRSNEEYVATLSHELRGPLNAILGWTQIIRARVRDPNVLERGIEVIEQNARIQAQLVSDLFDMHRIQSGKFSLSLKPVDLVNLVNSAADAALPGCQTKKLNLVRKIESQPCFVMADSSRITQVIMNLINNSVKFTPEGGEITVALENVEQNAVIRVIDNGKGIDPAILPTVFNRYTQGAQKDGGKHGGLGLGLSISRNLVQLHNGAIEAISPGLGHGATFQVSLPRIQPEQDISTYKVAPIIAQDLKDKDKCALLLNNIEILVVEDQDDARQAMVRILSDNGAEVASANSGIEALNELKQKLPKIIVSDISMPGMDGYTLIKEVREAYGDIPAIALTAFVRPEDRDRALAAGFNRHLPKPLQIPDLIATIRELTAE